MAGPVAGTGLSHIFLEHITWEVCKRLIQIPWFFFTQTGYRRDYQRDPSLGYSGRIDLMFPVNHNNARYHPKEWVLGVVVDGVAKVYPFVELGKTVGMIKDRVNGSSITIEFDPLGKSAAFFDSHHRPVPSVMAYWFAWYPFHPGTLIFKSQ